MKNQKQLQKIVREIRRLHLELDGFIDLYDGALADNDAAQMSYHREAMEDWASSIYLYTKKLERV